MMSVKESKELWNNLAIFGEIDGWVSRSDTFHPDYKGTEHELEIIFKTGCGHIQLFKTEKELDNFVEFGLANNHIKRSS